MSDFKLLKSIEQKLPESSSDLQQAKSSTSRLQTVIYNRPNVLKGIGFEQDIPQPLFTQRHPGDGQEIDGDHWIYSTDAGDTQAVQIIGYSQSRVKVIQNVTLTGQTSVALGTPFAHVDQFYIQGGVALGNVTLSTENNQLNGLSLEVDNDVAVCLTDFSLATGYFLGAFGDELISLQSAAVYHACDNPVEFFVCDKSISNSGPSGDIPRVTFSFTVEPDEYKLVDLRHTYAFNSDDGNPFCVYLIAREKGFVTADPRLHIELSALISM